MSATVAAALTDLSSRFDPSSWEQPIGSLAHLRALEEAITAGMSDYDDEFTYPPVPVDEYMVAISEVRALARSRLSNPTLGAAVALQLEGLASRALALASGNDERLSAVVSDLDGLPSTSLVSEANALLRSVPERPAAPVDSGYTASEAKSRLEQALGNYGLTDWRVEVSPTSVARMSVNGPMRRVRVREATRFPASELNRLLVHEIGGHVLRWVNASRQPEALASAPLGRTIPTEEGLALVHEARFGLAEALSSRVYAARTLAVQTARTQGILGVARTVLPHVGLRSAAEIAIRCKRGLRDPNGPGGATKDWSYLGGLLEMSRLSDEDPHGFQLLLGVKWSAEHLDLVRELHATDRIVEPRIEIDADRLGLHPLNNVGAPSPGTFGSVAHRDDPGPH